MKIAFFELEGWENEIIRKNFPTDELYLSDKKLDELNLPDRADFDVISVFVDSKINEQVLNCFPKLKFITTRSTGYDHIDLVACSKRNVFVSYVPGYGDNTVAEFAFGLILNLTRKIYHAIDAIKESGSFVHPTFRGTDIKGKTLGIIGVGRIGREMIKIGKGFGMNILAYDVFRQPQLAQELGFSYVTLEELLKNSDIISLHVPYSKETHHLINKNNISLIKRGAYLINTARGGVIETEALLFALREGILAGAGLDVLEEEGDIKDELTFLTKKNPREKELKIILENHLLMGLPNVLITPHNAFNSQEALERILETTIANIKSFIDGKPQNLAKS